MDKHECLAIVELLSVSWDKPIEREVLRTRANGYWTYISDLPAEACEIVIKDMAVGGRQWMPRPGELRVATITMMQGDEPPMSGAEAWADLQDRRSALHDGRAVASKAQPVLKQVMKMLGERATTLHTNGDRDMFVKLYETEREKYLIEQYGIKHG